MARYPGVLFVIVLVLVGIMSVSLAWQAPVAGFQNDATPAGSPMASPVIATGVVLLTEDQVPNGLVIIEDRDRSLDEITANFSDPAAARERFLDWGWRRNSIRSFNVPAGTSLDPGLIDGIYISVHEFGSSQAAAEALAYSCDVQAAATGLREMPIDPLGDTSRALYGRVAYGNEITIYVQQDNLLIRLSASSPEGDPQMQALDFVRTMLEALPAGS